MNKELLKKALPKGIACGVGAALLVALVRSLIRGEGFFGHLFSVYGILCLICFPIAWVLYYYNEAKKPNDKK